MLTTPLTLGSLFDGSGGFPLAGMLAGITPLWASEIEPFAILVTTARIPQMKHYGDISALQGDQLPPVDIITFGSPCQDMSICGLRAGLDGSRSSLFYEAIRIIKEMRLATNGEKPRWICWENVPGAFSSSGGRDFKAVLEAVIGVKEPGITVPSPDKNQWPYADCYLGDGWSVAYRVLDAQYWGVPQRRARIFLVADFGSERAPEILFKSEGLHGYSPQGGFPWESAAGDSSKCTGTASRPDGQRVIEAVALDGYNSTVSDKAATLGINCGISTGRNSIVLNDQGGKVMEVTENVVSALRAEAHNHLPIVVENHHAVAFTPDCEIHKGITGTITRKDSLNFHTQCVMTSDTEEPHYIVRRLTPRECARLQGFPAWWCSDLGIDAPTLEDLSFWTEVFETHRKLMGTSTKPKSEKQLIKWLRDPHSDAAEYKLWGNGVALPCVYFVLSGIAWAANQG